MKAICATTYDIDFNTNNGVPCFDYMFYTNFTRTSPKAAKLSSGDILVKKNKLFLFSLSL